MGCCWFVFWIEGRVRCVDCVCATEPPCPSGCGVTEVGAAAIGLALEKNTTLQELNLSGEFVVVCCVCGGWLIVVYVVVGCCWFVFWMEGRVRGVDCVCATEPPCSSDNSVSPALLSTVDFFIQRNRQVCRLSSPAPPLPPPFYLPRV